MAPHVSELDCLLLVVGFLPLTLACRILIASWELSRALGLSSESVAVNSRQAVRDKEAARNASHFNKYGDESRTDSKIVG